MGAESIELEGHAKTAEPILEHKRDTRFWWNQHMWTSLQQHGVECGEWLLPVIRGSIEIRTIYVGAKQARAGGRQGGKRASAGTHPLYLDQRGTCSQHLSPTAAALISRLTCLRAGTRFNARGIDDEGNAANFVETEEVGLMTQPCRRRFRPP